MKQTWAGDTNFDLWCSSHKLPIEVVKSQLSSNQLLLKTLFNHTPALRQICPLGELRACSYFFFFYKEKKFLWLSRLHHRDRTHSPVSPSPPHCDLPTSHLLLTHCYSPSQLLPTTLRQLALDPSRGDGLRRPCWACTGTRWCRCVSAHDGVLVHVGACALAALALSSAGQWAFRSLAVLSSKTNAV